MFLFELIFVSRQENSQLNKEEEYSTEMFDEKEIELTCRFQKNNSIIAMAAITPNKVMRM